MKTTKLRRSARDEDCQVRIPKYCNGDPATTVLAHLPGAGIGRKAADIHAAYACSGCHAVLDGHVRAPDLTATLLRLYHYDAVIRTQELMLQRGLITIG